MEDKQTTLDLLCETLQSTSRWDDIDFIEYVRDERNEEYAMVYLQGDKYPYRKICITADSCWAIITDVIKYLP